MGVSLCVYFNLGVSSFSDEEESSSDEYTDAADSDVEAAASPGPQEAAPRPPRAQHNELYFSDDSFGYDDYSDDGECGTVIVRVSLIFFSLEKINCFGSSD